MDATEIQMALGQLRSLFAEYEEHLKKHGGKYLAGKQITYVDLIVLIEIDTMQTLFQNF